MAIANSDGSIIITTKLDVTPVSKALNVLKSKFASLKEQRSAIQALTMAIKDQQFVIKDLEKEYAMLVAQGKGNSTNAEELKARIAELKAELQQLTGAASTMGVKTAAASTKVSVGLKKFGTRIADIIKSAVIFSLLYKVMQSVVKLFKNILMSDEEFRQDWEELKAAFYTAAYPIINLIVPAIKWIVQQVRDWAVSIGKVAAALQGMSYSELVDQAKASKEAADNYEDMEKSSKKTADNVKKQLASFDDIQILSSGNDEEQGTGLAGFEGLKEYDTSGEKSMLDDLMTAIGGALMAVGLILLFHGQISWGIGFIIAGAFGIAAATLTDESVSQKAKDELSNAMLIVGAVAVILGILLCMAQQWVYGIALIALGVSSIVAPIALNWNGIKAQLQTSLGGWLVLGGVIAIILGILLCFTPALPLGIGLIVLGAGAVVTPIVANWDAISSKITEIFNSIISWIKNNAMLIIGIILTLAGMLPLGIALIIESVKAKKSGQEPSWNLLLEKIKEVWANIKAFWNVNIAPIFTAEWWLNLGKTCINGLIAGFEGGINGIIMAFESMINWIVDGLNKISFELPDWIPEIGGKRFGVNIPKASFGRVKIPRLAQGAVIPPNKEFLAVLGDQKSGTNIEAPLSTIQEAVSAVVGSQNEETQNILREILEAILGIQIGDDVIGRASQRYNNTMVKMYGG